MLFVFASSFRILVTFALVLEVHGIFLLPNTLNDLWQKFVEPKDHNQGALKEYSIHIVPLSLSTDLRLSIDSQEYACVRLSMPTTFVVRQAILSRND